MTATAEHLSKTAADTLCKDLPGLVLGPMMRAGRPARAAGFVPHRSPVMGVAAYYWRAASADGRR
jgi:hypothetical protein